MSDVFISYARSTATQAQTVVDALRGLGYDVWFDEQLPVHRSYTEVLEERLKSAKAVVVLWSEEAVKSHWVQAEADLARVAGTLVQLRLDDAALPLPFNRVQCADMRGWRGSLTSPEWRKVIGSIEALGGAASPTTLPTHPSSQWTRASLPSRRHHNLPVELSSFIGRVQEVADVSDLLAHHRLVTLVGVGGCGKTRLALAVANIQLDVFPDGVWLAELGPISEPERLLPAILRLLDLGVADGTTPLDTLLWHLRDRQLLLVLDNCEHLIGATAELAETLLKRAPGLRILATSREHLRIRGEHTFAVPTLDVPDPAMAPTPSALSEVASVQLFVERAIEAAPGFSLTPANAPAVAAICTRLDGIALALELAAARVRAIAVQDIAARLARNLDLLTGGSRTALPRQRTLQATLDWSHDLLEQAERVLLRRLSLFEGEFTLDEAEAVASAAPLHVADIIDLVTQIAERSMLQVVVSRSGRTRYRMQEVVRAYAETKLKESGEWIAIKDRRRDYLIPVETAPHEAHSAQARAGHVGQFDYADLELASTPTNGGVHDDTATGARTDAQSDAGLNCDIAGSTPWMDAAHAIAQRADLHSARALYFQALRESNVATRRALFEESWSLATSQGDEMLESITCLRLATDCKVSGEADVSSQTIESTLTQARQRTNANVLGWSLFWLGSMDAASFLARGEECVDAFRRAENDFALAQALRRLCFEGLLAEAFHSVPQVWPERLLELGRAHGDPGQISHAQLCQGVLAERQGNLRGAIAFMEDSAATAAAPNRCRAHCELARLLWLSGDLTRAEALADDLIRESIEFPGGLPWIAAMATFVRALIVHGRGDPGGAAQLLGVSLRLRKEALTGVYATERAHHDRLTAALQTTLGEPSYVSLLAAGTGWTLERVAGFRGSDEPASRDTRT